MTDDLFKPDGFLKIRECSICGDAIGLRAHTTHAVVFMDTRCGCSRYGRELTLDEVAEWSRIPVIASPLGFVANADYDALAAEVAQLTAELTTVKAERDEARADVDHLTVERHKHQTRAIAAEAALATARAEGLWMQDALMRIAQWAGAYPSSVFPSPDLERAARVLQGAGMTLDALSADAMRHAMAGVGKIARDAISAAPREGGDLRSLVAGITFANQAEVDAAIAAATTPSEGGEE